MILSFHQLCSILNHSSVVHSDFIIRQVASINNPSKFSLLFCRKLTSLQLIKLSEFAPICVLVENIVEEVEGVIQLKVENPRLTFIEVIHQFFSLRILPKISSTAIIHETAQIGDNVFIGEYTVIGANTIIEDECQIMSHVSISENVCCGKGTIIKSGSVIGQKGFGFERDSEGTPIEFPHIGGVIIGDWCEIGALTTIASGTLEPTKIGNYVKIDDHVHIAHNVSVGDKTLIAACAEVSGSVVVGSRVWISPNTTIINKISIGDRAFIGIGSVVIKNVSNCDLVNGNPAKFFRKVKPGRDPV